MTLLAALSHLLPPIPGVPRPPDQPYVQLAVAVDDREEVWDETSRPALLQVGMHRSVSRNLAAD
jgi:hypothetical protein